MRQEINWSRKGADKERRIVNAARKEGLIAARARASKGAIDVFIIDPVSKVIKLVQCKSDNAPLSMKERLRKELLYLEGYYNVVVDVV